MDYDSAMDQPQLVPIVPIKEKTAVTKPVMTRESKSIDFIGAIRRSRRSMEDTFNTTFQSNHDDD